MIKVTVSTVDERKTIITDESKTPKQVLDEAGISYTRATLMIDGIILDATTVNKPLNVLTTGDECMLAVSIKMDNA